jgi:hypothetical protein
LSILHTWGQTLTPHPHIHCVIPGGGLALDHSRWIASRSTFLLPIKVLSRVFRGKFVAGLRRLFASDQLRFFGECIPLHEKKRFALFLRMLYRQDWVVYAKPPFGGPEHVLHYLARYTHRVAISNHRLLSVSASEVRFCWKDYAHGSKQRTMTLASEEFLRRFAQHVLPRGFPRIRYFGFLANRRRARMLPLRRALLHQAPPADTPFRARPTLWKCPRCHGLMHLVERLAVAQLFFAQRKRPTCLTPPSCQSKAAFTVYFPACSLEVCLRPKYSTLPLPNAASRSVSPHRLRMVAENFHSTLHVSSDCLGTSQSMKNP